MRTHDDKPREANRIGSQHSERTDPTSATVVRAGSTAEAGLLGPNGVLALQRLAGNAAVVQLLHSARPSNEEGSPVKEVVGRGGGEPLDPGTRAMMEAGLKQDFADVRVHTGPKPADSARSIGASAYTVGTDVVFGGSYDPSNSTTQRTLAHELTHVIQQRHGPVAGSPAPGGIRVSDPADRFEREAERRAGEFMSSLGHRAGHPQARTHAGSTPERDPGRDPGSGEGAAVGVQRMATRAELVNQTGEPKADKRFLGVRVKKMSVAYQEVLDAVDSYDRQTRINVAKTTDSRAQQGAVLRAKLDAIARAAGTYTAAHANQDQTAARDARLSRIAALANEITAERVIVGEIEADARLDNAGRAGDWRTEIKARQFDTSLMRAATAESNAAYHASAVDRLYDQNASKKVNEAVLAMPRKAAKRAGDLKEQHYAESIDLLLSAPQLIGRLPLRKLNLAIREAQYSASSPRAGGLMGHKVASLYGSDLWPKRIEAESDRQDRAIAAKVRAAKNALMIGNWAFAPNELVELTRPEEDIEILCGSVQTSAGVLGNPAPTWTQWAPYRAKARVQRLIRLYRQAHPDITFQGLPRSIQSDWTEMRAENPLKAHAEEVFREDVRARGDALGTLDRAREGARARAGDDYQAALVRLQTELGVPAHEVEELLKRCLLALAAAPLTVNFSHEKLHLILRSGGFKNYWEVNPVLMAPPPLTGQESEDEGRAHAEQTTKHKYQEQRLAGEAALFGGTDDIHQKMLRSDEQSISTAANITEDVLGAAPSRDYGRSVAVLKERVKQRATYTPWDALVFIRRVEAGQYQGILGPEFVATHDNLAAVIRHGDPPAIKDIVEKAKNPGKVFDQATPNYIEAQIHGPLTLADIARITISEDDLEDNAYRVLQDRWGEGARIGEVAAARYVSALKSKITRQLAAVGVDVGFARIEV
jgi:hypothetical protein